MRAIPSTWRAGRISDVSAKPQYGWTSAAKQDAGGLPLLRTTDISRGPIDWSVVPRCLTPPPDPSRFMLKRNDIVVSRAGSVGISALIADPPPSVFASYLMRLQPTADVLPRFLALFMKSPDYWSQISEVTNGIALPNINATKLAAVELPIPPLDEQRRIINILEDHLSRLDAAAGSLVRARTGLDDLLALAAEAAYRGSSFADAGGSHSAPELPSSDKVRKRIVEPAYSPPFELAEGRRWCSVDAAATLVTDGDHNPPRRVPSGIPHVTAKGIRNGQIVLDGCTYVSEEGFEQTSRRYAPLPGDVLVTCVGTIGRVAVVPEGIRFSADRNLAAIRPHDSFISAEFLALCLNSVSLQQRMRNVSGSTAQPHLYLKDLRGLPLAVPDAATQAEVVGAAMDLRSGVMRRLDEIASQEKRAALLRRSLMSAAFSGRLNGRSTDMEIVEEMAGV
jgi:type I restriction enzyme, S subunit